MKLTDFSITHRTTVWVLMVMMAVFGGFAYWSLPREAAPDVQIPIILVTTNYRGVTPADIENTVTIPIEKRLRGLKNVKEIRSKSAEGSSLIIVEFYSGTNIEAARQRVRDKVDEAQSELPVDADEPTLKEINVAEIPILSICLAWKNPSGKDVTQREREMQLVRLKGIAEDLRDRIEPVQGVLEAEVVGGLTREIRVEFDPDRLAAYRIPVSELAALVAQENVNVSGGNIEMERGRYQLRVDAQFADPLEIYNLVITAKDDKPVFVTDLARIVDGFEDRSSYSRFNGQESVTLLISKRAGENVVRITDQIKEIMANSKDLLGENVSAHVTLDMSQDIRRMVEDLESNIVSGLLLIVVVLLLVMGVRNAFFVGLAIPFSMLITFGTLMALGITLNMVVLFSLVLSLGMLVDNAIVIVENIYRHMQEGQGRLDAALMGAREVAWPVVASTLTTVVAFAPMLFWPDIVGDFMSYLPKTVIVALLASLFVALVVNPTLCGAMMKKPRLREAQTRPNWFVRAYLVVLRVCLRLRWLTVAAAVGVLVFSIVALGRWGHGVEFFPESEPNQCYVNVKLPEGSTLDQTDAAMREIVSRIQDVPDRKYVLETAGVMGGTNPLSGGAAGSNYGQVVVEFVDRQERTQSSVESSQMIRERVQGIPGARIEVMKPQHGPPTGSEITIEVSGEDFDVLAETAQRIQSRIREVDDLVDLRNDYESAKPELRFIVDRDRAKLLGVNTAWVANYIKLCVNGLVMGKYREGEDEYDIVLRLAEEYRYDLDRLRALHVPDAAGRPIPLSSLATIEYRGGFGAISRVDQNRVITIEGGAAEGVQPTEVLGRVKARLSDLRLPRRTAIAFRGQDEEMHKSMSFLMKALVAALFLILLVMVAEFDSMTLPGVIMTAVLLSLVGVIWSLILSGRPFGVIMTGIGVISLAGVVVNNGIVLIDYTQKLRRRGMDGLESILQGGATRLRPVLLTAITTILGLLPMAVGVSWNVRKMTIDVNSESSQWWGSMATVVIYGLAAATVLTLVVVPVMYSIVTRTSVKKRRDHESIST